MLRIHFENLLRRLLEEYGLEGVELGECVHDILEALEDNFEIF